METEEFEVHYADGRQKRIKVQPGESFSDAAGKGWLYMIFKRRKKVQPRGRYAVMEPHLSGDSGQER